MFNLENVIEGIEKWGMKLPDSFVEFVNSGKTENNLPQCFYGYGSGNRNKVCYFIEKYCKSIADINFAMHSLGNKARTSAKDKRELVPIARCRDGYYLCLDYRYDDLKPRVVIYDRSTSKKFVPTTFCVTETFDEFVAFLKSPYPAQN